jgi:beta-lactamase superfamily II metal-dependent hydrolase
MENSFDRYKRRKRFAIICIIILVLVCIFSTAIGLYSQKRQSEDCSITDSTCLTSKVNKGAPQSAPIIEKEGTPSQIPTTTSKNICQVHFIDVGMGDSELIVTPDQKTVLIDGGERDSGIVNYLKSIGIEAIDVMIASHAHSDHIGGLIDVMQAFPVSNVITNGRSYTTTIFDDFLGGITKTKASYTEVSRGSSISIDGITLNVLSPDKASTDDDVNETSLMIRMVCGGVTFLFTGDAGETSEYLTAQAGMDVQADILKVGHHGSSTSSSSAFLDSVHPSVAVISVGKDNDLNLPNPDTITRLLSRGILLFRTDENGTIVVTAEDGKYTISHSN